MCDMPHSSEWHVMIKLPVRVARFSLECIHACDMTYFYVWHDPLLCAPWLIHMCDLTRTYVWDYPFMRVTCRYTAACSYRSFSVSMHSCVWHDSFIGVIRRIHTCDMTNSYMWRDSFTWKTCRDETAGPCRSISMWMHSHVWHDNFICVTWRIHIRDMTESHV